MRLRRAVGVILIVVSAVLAGCRSPTRAEDGSGTATEVLESAAGADYPDRYRFVDQPDLPLLSCLTGDGPVDGVVDRDAGIAALVQPGTTRPWLILTPGQLFVSRDALDGWRVPSPWVMATPETAEGDQAALAATLGSTAAAYALRFDLPEEPGAVATALLAADGQPTLVDETSARALRAERAVRTEIGGDALLPGEATTEDSRDDALIVELYTDDADRVVRVTARPVAISADTHGQAPGYRTDYFDFGDVPPITVPSAQTVSSLEGADAPARAAAVDRCAGPTGSAG